MSALLPALSADAMREADRLTIETFGIPGFTLMESAGRAAARAIETRLGSLPGKRIGCFCGKGNNGGDGYVVARVLFTRGAHVTVYSMGSEDQLTPDAGLNYELLRQIADHDEEGRLHLLPFTSPNTLDASSFDLLVDGLLGTGVRQHLKGPYDQLVAWMNAHPAPTVALDMPTGLHTDSGLILGTCVEADVTVTMGALKTGLLLGEGPRVAGRIEVVEIGIPDFILRQTASGDGCAWTPTRESIRSWFPIRPHDAHKYSVGMALALAGSPGLTGAATLASTAAARSGAGAVICATSKSIQPILAQKMTEVMTIGLPETERGIDGASAMDHLQNALQRAAALLVGCGLGSLPDTRAFARALLTQSTLPAVIDADGLNAIAENTDLLPTHARGRWILTPHLGEFRRLAGEDVNLENRIETVRRYARQWNCVLILKGAPSLTGAPDGNVFINPTGNNALASAGTGDVLAGLCVGLLAQGLTPLRAALCALYIGGAAADRYTQNHSPLTLQATDLIEQAGAVIDELYY